MTYKVKKDIKGLHQAVLDYQKRLIGYVKQ